MPDRENPAPDPNGLPGDLFANLPEPSHEAPAVDSSPPAPGSRRARREAAMANGTAAPAAVSTPVVPATPASPAAVEEPAPATRQVPTVAAAPAQTLEDLFVVEQPTEVERTERKKKRRAGCLTAFVILLVIIGGAVGAGVWAMNTYGDQINELLGTGEPKDWEPGIATGEAFVTIHEGDTGSPISAALYEAGVTKTEDVFYDYLVTENIAVTFYPGVYPLQQKMTAAAALEVLRNPDNQLAHTVAIAEGGTVKGALTNIAETIGLPLEDLQAAVADPAAYGVAADTLEGWLFPAVYTFAPEVTAPEVIARMVDRTRESLDGAGVPADQQQRVLTIASIVQREGHTADFDKVARVIENRLDPSNDDTHGLLQMDSTAQYGYGLTHDGPVSSWPWAEVVGDQNPWNTYVHVGLPASPISNPSDAAIRAAQNPAEGPWLYFVTVNLDTGETVFSETYAEQQAAEAEYRTWCAENPDRGCY